MDIENTILLIYISEDDLQSLAGIFGVAGFHVEFHKLDEFDPALVTEIAPIVILLQVRQGDAERVAHISNPDISNGIPVIVLSESERLADKVGAFDAGAVDYITVPFVFEEVISRVQTHIKLHHQTLEIQRLRRSERRYFHQLNQMREDLLRTTTHDLKNPLSVVTSYAELLTMLPPIRDDERSQFYVEQILEGASRMQQLIAELLEIAQLETGLSLRPSLFQLKPLLERQVNGYQAVAAARDIRLLLDVRDEMLFAEVDESKFQRVIENLLSNAVKYSREGGEVRVVLADADPPGEMAVIRVSDNGLGIPQRDQKRVFEKFYRVKSAEHRAQAGSGLGLAVARLIVEQHGGEIEVESDMGEGSTFTVRLPQYNPEPDEAPETARE